MPQNIKLSQQKQHFLRWTNDELDLEQFVKLPPNVNENEWLAAHIINLFNNITILYEIIAPYCTPVSCPKMTGPKGENYYQESHRKSILTNAPAYIDWVFSKCTEYTANQETFPTKYGQSFGPDFLSYIKKMTRWLLSILAHLYANHFEHLQNCGDMHIYTNQLLSHIVILGEEYNLIEPENRAPLDDLLQYLLPKGLLSQSPTSTLVTHQAQLLTDNSLNAQSSSIIPGTSGALGMNFSSKNQVQIAATTIPSSSQGAFSEKDSKENLQSLKLLLIILHKFQLPLSAMTTWGPVLRISVKHCR